MTFGINGVPGNRTDDLTIVTSTLSDNRASYGGGIYAEKGVISMARSGIYNCSASVDGGGIYVWQASGCSARGESDTSTQTCNVGTTAVSLASSAITHNAADGLGGGVHILQRGFLDAANDVIISANTALSGFNLFITNISMRRRNQTFDVRNPRSRIPVPPCH